MDVIQTITAEDVNGVAAAGVTVNVRLDSLDSNSAWTGSATTNSSGQVSFQLSRASEGDYQVSITGGSEHDATLDTENPSCYDTVGNTEFSCP